MPKSNKHNAGHLLHAHYQSTLTAGNASAHPGICLEGDGSSSLRSSSGSVG